MNSSHHGTIDVNGENGRTQEQGWISDSDFQQATQVLAILLGSVSSLGFTTNTINCAVFLTQGLKDSMTASLLALSVSDLSVCTTSMFVAVCWSVQFLQIGGVWLKMTDLSYQFSNAHSVFSRISGCLAAFIVFERCMAVVTPLKVKHIVTVHRTSVVIVCIYLVNFVLSSPFFYGLQLRFNFDKSANMSVIGSVYVEEAQSMAFLSFIINFNIIQPGFMVVNIILTIILLFNLKKKSAWRVSQRTKPEDSATEKKHLLSQKDAYVAKMVTFLSCFNIACFTPIVAYIIVKLCIPELRGGRRLQNTELVLGLVSVSIQTANATFNIFIYVSMSTIYRHTLKKLLRIKQGK